MQVEQTIVSHLEQYETIQFQHLAELLSAKVPTGQLKESTQSKLVVKQKPDQQIEQILASHLAQLKELQFKHLAELMSANAPSGQLRESTQP